MGHAMKVKSLIKHHKKSRYLKNALIYFSIFSDGISKITFIILRLRQMAS